MKDGLDLSLVNSGTLVKRGYSFLIANVGKTVALITLAIVALISFTEISFSGLGAQGFTSTLVMMLIASYVMYFSLEDAGEKLGRECEEYKQTVKRYKELKDRINGDDLPRLRQFCLDYRQAELEYRRWNTLFSLGYTKEEYESYLRGDKIPKKARKALGRVKKIKCADLTAANLLSGESMRKKELKNPEESRIFHMILSLIPSTVCMIFTISVMISLKESLSVEGIIEALVKISTLPIIGLKGYSGGYEYVTNEEKEWLEIKSSLIESFINKNA